MSSSRRYKSAAAGTRRRSAMGEYLPAPGERPLSSFGDSSSASGRYNSVHAPLRSVHPSAFDYYPSTRAALPNSPSHSISSRPFTFNKEAAPGPGEYPTRKDSVWNHRTFTLTRKGITRPYDPRENAHITCSPGAGHYCRVNGDVGMGLNAKRSLSARHREGIHVGYPNSLIQPADTLGFGTPGPALWREAERGPERTFGFSLKPSPKEEGQHGPGPANYSLPTPTTPGKSIGLKLLANGCPSNPSPNEYTIPGTVGTGQSKTFGIRKDIDTDQKFPSPNTYTVPRSTSVCHSFNYRPFSPLGEQAPGPAEYTKTESDLPKAPDYSCRERCRPTYPDILLYPEHTPLDFPGPGEYEYDREFADNSAPKYSHGLPLPTKPKSNPGPNHYHIKHTATQSCPPSFSMARTLSSSTTAHSASPGPADYTPRPRPSSAASITPRRTRDTGSAGPAANHYHVPGTQTRYGHFPGHMASMKGRRSTACYSGFPSGQLARLASLAM